MFEIDKEKVKKHFSRHAENYDKYAILQKEMGELLLEQIKKGTNSPKSILDVGTGTGEMTLKLPSLFPEAEITAIDIAEGMIKVARSKSGRRHIKFESADGEFLPYPSETFDILISNAALQWMNLALAYPEFFRVLKPKGNLFFTTFGPQTLKELDNLGFSKHLFPAKEEHLKLLNQKFQKVEIFSQNQVKDYSNLKELFCFIKKTGAQSAFIKTDKSRTFGKVRDKNLDAPVSVTWEIIWGVCRK